MRESELKSAVCEYLDVQQKMGKLIFLRLNSGSIIEARGDTRRRIKCCEKGTADILVIQYYQSADPEEFEGMPAVLFLELKSEKGRQSPDQKNFQRIAEAQGAEYHIIRELDEVMELVG